MKIFLTGATGFIGHHVAQALAAVPQGADGAAVWVVERGRAHRVRVDVGAARNDRMEIRQGLAGGESLVLQPPATLRDGIEVKVAGR